MLVDTIDAEFSHCDVPFKISLGNRSRAHIPLTLPKMRLVRNRFLMIAVLLDAKGGSKIADGRSHSCSS